MSEVTKPVDTPVVAPSTTEIPVSEFNAAESIPTTTTTAETVQPTTDTPAVTELPAKEETAAAPVKEEVKPVEEGTLGYKGPGLLKSFIFQKKHFWFGTEPVETKSLSSYLRGEKDAAAANHTAAWASHTGKGLLFFSKKATDKTSPAGVFNLSEVSELTPEGTVDFAFTSGGHKHTFQATHLAERDNWVAVLTSKIEEAKSMADSVKESETYKTNHSALTKPSVAAATASTPKEAAKEEKKEEKKEIKEEKKEEKAEAKEEKKEEKAEKKEEKKEIKEEKKEEKKSRKSRSASRKRTSIFGGIGFGKKEDKSEVAKEETPVVAPTTEEAAVAPVEATPAVGEPVVASESAVPALATEEATSSPETAKPTPNKRNSIFGTLQSRFSSTKEKKPESEALAPAVPAKDAEVVEPVSETAPVIPAVESTEPLGASVESPATVPTETTTLPTTNGESKTETPVTKSDKRKSSLPWLTKKEKPTSDSEGEKEKPKSPFAKLRATVKGKKADKAEKSSEAKTEEPEVIPSSTETKTETPAVEEPVVSEPIPAVTTTTPQVAASA
ncbi:hypothetical protein LSUE1_G008426 [Lachnellula suecica]|uniref:Meiotic expression up-regulated protein 6 PH domain-containing protein n=1 Tax=Lachnellula suecica TaxID=602035 RepID=A0A8T9C8U7_9HELO|nr:hypothetical protein LSUE1_G008426 [Lachnellula suecica]